MALRARFRRSSLSSSPPRSSPGRRRGRLHLRPGRRLRARSRRPRLQGAARDERGREHGRGRDGEQLVRGPRWRRRGRRRPDGWCSASSCPPVPAGPCASLGTVTCTDGGCGVTYTAGPALSQVYGNCQQNMCDGNGVMTSGDDNSNVLDNGTCNFYTCSNGVPTPNPQPEAQCSLMGLMGFCVPNPDPDNPGIYICGGCNPITQAPCTTVPNAPYCVGGQCVSTPCKTPDADGGCGGINCLPCADGRTCNAASDCFTNECSGPVGMKTCQAPTCSDGQQNGTETDVDCGGMKCPACATGYKCLVPNDCQSSVSGVCLLSQAGQPVRDVPGPDLHRWREERRRDRRRLRGFP